MPRSTTKLATPGVLTIVLFGIYALLLVSVILFKFPFQYQLTASGRHLNLVPFAGSSAGHRGFDVSDFIENVLIFVPLGLYVSMLKPGWSFGIRVLAIAATSVAFETLQFAFAIGRSDITDVLGNTLGGVVGIGIYAISTKVLRNRANRVLTIIELVVTIVALAFFTFLRAHSK